MSFVSACWRLCYCTVEVLTGTSHLLYIKRTLHGFKCYFLCAVFFSHESRWSSVHSRSTAFWKPWMTGDFYIWKNSTQLNKTEYWDRKTAGQIQFLCVECCKCSEFTAFNYTWVFFHTLVCWHGCKTILIQLSSVIFFFSSSYDRVFIMVPKGFKCLKAST